jgi:hypothetical protein
MALPPCLLAYKATMNSVTLLNGLKAPEDAIASMPARFKALPCV